MRALKLSCLPVLRLLAMLGLLLAAPAWAQNEAAKAEMAAALKEAQAVQVVGPAEVKLLSQAVLKLPKAQVYIPAPAAAKLMRAMGNRTDDRLVGVIFPDGNEQWMVVVKYESAGYIKDDDARDWKTDEMFDNIKAGTEQANAERRSRGIPEMEITGWVEKPTYDAQAHRLVWSISSRDKGYLAGGYQGINYNTYALGREGYVSMNLVTELKQVEAHKPIARELLAALDFNAGKRYADFNSSTDKVAEYGIAALVGGIAAKKLGLFAIIAAFVAKFFKVFIIGLIAAVPVLGKLFKRKPAEPVVGTTPGDTVFAADGGGSFPDTRPKAGPFAPTRPLGEEAFPATRPLEPIDPFPATRPLEIDPFPPTQPFPLEPEAPPGGATPPAVPPGTPPKAPNT